MRRRKFNQGYPLPAISKRFLIQKMQIDSLEARLLLSASVYTWQNAQIGAGGFVDGIFFSPTQPQVIYARTDIGGLYKTTDGGTDWTQLLDFVGRSSSTSGNGTQSQEIGVLGFAIDPENPNNLYADVGEYSGTNGAVLYSTDAGQTWGTTNLPFYVGGNSNGRGDGEQIAVDPNDSNIVLLGSNNAGLWMSTDAGHSFAQITGGSTGLNSALSTTFVMFDPASGTPGQPSQRIYLGINSTKSTSGTNLYLSNNAGLSWTKLTGTGTLPNRWVPGHAVISGDSLYLGYANGEAPDSNLTTGGVFRFTRGTTASNGIWANISPQTPGGSNPAFGYDAIAADVQDPGTIVVTSFDRYSGPDQIWRTTNANSSNPTWTALFSTAGAQNYGYGGFNPTRDTSSAPWVAAFGDGIGNWAATVAIDPFNSAHIMYGTGQGIWATDHGNSSTPLTAPNSWYFPSTGIEFTAVGGVAAPPTGVPLLSAMGDIGGFAHTTLTSSPALGSIGGSGYSIDFAGQNPSIVAIVGNMGNTNGSYSTDEGISFTPFAANPGGGSDYAAGTVAVSANGGAIVWAPSGQGAYYSTDGGASWIASGLGDSGLLPTGGTIVADRVNANYFYYWTENTDDNSWTLYISSDSGRTFSVSAGGALGTGNAALAANPFVAGDLWLSTYIGIYHSSDFGANFSHGSSYAMSGNTQTFAVGAAAPGSEIPALYVFGTLNNFQGIYRSDDGGDTWVQLNDIGHQWGGLIQTVAADPNVFGRVYLGINGRGVIVGNPTSTLPDGWSDTDINTPGNPGRASSSTTLSTSSTVNQWIVNGGGTGLDGNSDQFNFAFTPLAGDAVVSARLVGLTDADGSQGSPAAGVMFRAGSDANEPFVSLTQSSESQCILQYRLAPGGSVASVPLSGIPVGGEYLELVRTGNTFAAYYSSTGTTWTQLGSSISISSMPAVADAGLAVSADYNPQLASANFANVSAVALVRAQVAAPNQISFAFTDDASSRLSLTSLTVQPLLAGAAVAGSTFEYDNTSNVATYQSASPIVSGLYQATLSLNLGDVGGQPLLLSHKFDFLIVDSGTNLKLTGDDQVYTVGQLLLADSAQLDLGNNTVVVQYTGVSPAGMITPLIDAGFDRGQWNGTGIVSSAAANDPARAIGVGEFDNGTSVKIAASWYGDVNLSDTIDADDWSLLLVARSGNQQPVGWQSGDFNYDQRVNADDWMELAWGVGNSKITSSTDQFLPVSLNSAQTENSLLYSDGSV